MDFLCEFECRFGDTFWELLAVTGSLLGVLGVVPGASGSGQILSARRPAARNVFFLAPILEQENGILVEETTKNMPRKVILR